MIDGFKNRECVQERYESALNRLSHGERNEYIRDGNITVYEPTDAIESREVEEKQTDSYHTRRMKLNQILNADFYSCSVASDGVPTTSYLHWIYGLITIIRFSDNTLHVWCNDLYLEDLFADLTCQYESEIIGNIIRVDLNKKGDENWKINKLKQLLKQ